MTETITQQVEWISDCQNRVNQRLLKLLPDPSTAPANLHEALRYSVINGGKRLRPLLVYATGLSFNASPDQLDIPAASIELIHCYSLVHDDLPAMDDDDLRRGKPSCHKAFDEATAILVGDALQALAFEILANFNHPRALELIKTLSQASGSLGMVGGQALDLASESRALSLTELQQLHRLKTGALFQASVRMGAITAGLTNKKLLMLLDQFAARLGLCFQIQDDILDVESSSEQLGKTVGKDQAQHKATYVNIMGLSKAKELLLQEHLSCQRLLKELAPNLKNNTLATLVKRCVFRDQ